MKRFVFALALAATLPFAAQAAEFNQVQVDQSAITFNYQQMGVKMDGRFKTFNAQLAFDPAKPASAKASFDVELASVDTGSADADSATGSADDPAAAGFGSVGVRKAWTSRSSASG